MKDVVVDQDLVSYCGLYCGACKKFVSGKCPGCHENKNAGWCTVRACNLQNNYKSCADCKEFQDPMDCTKYNNFFSKFFALVFRSDRAAGITKIKSDGYRAFAAYMAVRNLQAIKRK